VAAITFGDLTRQFHLEWQSIDYMLCRQWVLDAYKRACTNRQWGFLRAEGQLTNGDARAITVGVIQGSPTVTSAAAFTAFDNGRQFRVGGLGIPFTMTFVNTSQVTLDRNYEGATNTAASATIFDAYVALPADCDSIRSLINPTNYRPMPWMLSREILDYWDPNRVAQDSTARMVVSHRMSQVTGQTGRMLYEWWPYPSTRAVYPMTYYRRPDTIVDTDAFVGVLSTRAEELLNYARYRASLYPGTPDVKNPGFNPSVARIHLDDWNKVLESLAARDDDQFLQSIDLIDWRWVMAGLPFDSGLLRATDASGYQAWLGTGGYSY
jgi:hypothetical protein